MDNSFKIGYDPELDASPELEPESALYFKTIMVINKWMIELRRIDIITKVSF